MTKTVKGEIGWICGKCKAFKEPQVTSSCCGSGITTHHTDEGTSWCSCNECDEPCDPIFNPTEETMDELIEKNVKFSHGLEYPEEEVRESWEEWKANSAEELSRYLHVAPNGRIYVHPSPAEDYSEWGNENHRESFVQLVDGLVAQVRQQAIQETVEKIGQKIEDISFHYKRECHNCSTVNYSLHCPHDGVQGRCKECNDRLPQFTGAGECECYFDANVDQLLQELKSISSK